MVVCTQRPGVRAVSVTFPAEREPVKVGAFVIETAGVGPVVTVMLPEPVTAVVDPQAAEVTDNRPPVEA